MAVILRAPLWPAGHLPLKGGDQPRMMASLNRPRRSRNSLSIDMSDDAAEIGAAMAPISPLAGKMAGRPEEGLVERRHRLMNAVSRRRAL